MATDTAPHICPRIAESLDELVAGATDRVEVRTSDAKSGARFERLVIDGERYFLKSLSAADDWIMRVTGNTSNWEFKVWQAGIYAETPPVIDHTIRGMALEGGRLSILMTDCGDDLVPPGDDPVPARAPRRLHRRHGGDARALPGLARRPRPAGPVPSLAVLRARDDRPRARGGRRAGPDRGRPPGLGAAPRARASPPRAGPRRCTATPTRSATRCAPRRSPSWPGTGSSATSATAPTAAPSCSTGPTRARRRRAGT